MIFTGRFLYAGQDFASGQKTVTFSLNESLAGLDEIRDTEVLSITAEPFKKKRSLSQNALYWKLLNKLAAKLQISNARLHNILLRRVAPSYIVDGKVVMQAIPDTEEAENQALESEVFHIAPTSGVIESKDGQIFRWYKVLRGTSTFNVSEMTVIVDELIRECEENGISTISPDELERIREYERQKENQRTC